MTTEALGAQKLSNGANTKVEVSSHYYSAQCSHISTYNGFMKKKFDSSRSSFLINGIILAGDKIWGAVILKNKKRFKTTHIVTTFY